MTQEYSEIAHEPGNEMLLDTTNTFTERNFREAAKVVAEAVPSLVNAIAQDNESAEASEAILLTAVLRHFVLYITICKYAYWQL